MAQILQNNMYLIYHSLHRIIVLLDIPLTYSRTRRPDKNRSSCLEMWHSLALSWDVQDLSAVEGRQEPLETRHGHWVLGWMGEILLAPQHGVLPQLSPAHDCNVYNGTLVQGHSCTASHKLAECYKMSKIKMHSWWPIMKFKCPYGRILIKHEVLVSTSVPKFTQTTLPYNRILPPLQLSICVTDSIHEILAQLIDQKRYKFTT